VRGLVGELRCLRRCDDHPRVVDAVDAAQSGFDIARQAGTRLRVDDGLRRQDADRTQRFAGAREVGMRNAGERKTQQQIVAPPGVDDDVVGGRRERDAPGGQPFLDLTELFGMQRRRKERDARRVRQNCERE
jgi:hypothetical protein